MPEPINADDCPSPIVVLFGRQLRQRRRELRLTQGQISEQTGVSVPYLSVIESGRTNPSLELVEKLARSVGLEAWQMLYPFHP